MTGRSRFEPFKGATESLIDLCLEITDCHHSTPNWTDSGNLVIRNFNIKNGFLDLSKPFFTDKKTFKDRIRRSVPEPGDLIITREAPMGEVCIIPDGVECCLGQRMVLIKPNHSKVTSEFLLFALQSEFVQKQIQKSDKTGSIVSNLRIPVLKELQIPKFGAQSNMIGKILWDINSKIDLNNRINQELEAMVKLIYDYWFVQFDFPDAHGKPYKSSGGKMVYNEQLKREIPEGWEVKELGDDLKIQRGMSYKSSEIKGDGIPMINLNSFNLDGTYKSKGVKMYSGKYKEKNLVFAGDLLIAVTDVTRNADIIGKAIIVPDFYDDLVCSMDIAKISSEGDLTESYLMMLFNSQHYHNYIKWFASGTIVLHLNLDGMKWYKAEIPPRHLLEAYQKQYEVISKRIAQTTKQNQKLSELRDWLLPMLMNGQVTVGEAKEYVQDTSLHQAQDDISMAAEEGGEYGRKFSE